MGGVVAVRGTASLRFWAVPGVVALHLVQRCLPAFPRSSAAVRYRHCSMRFLQVRRPLPKSSAQGKRRFEGLAVEKGVRSQNHLPLFRGNRRRMDHPALYPR